MSASRGFGAAPNRAIPPNPRYANTSTKLNTGHNMRRILEASQGSGPNAHKKQQNEFFVRLKAQTLGRLLEPLVETQESIYQLANEEMGSWFGFDSPLTVEDWDFGLQRVGTCTCSGR